MLLQRLHCCLDIQSGLRKPIKFTTDWLRVELRNDQFDCEARGAELGRTVRDINEGVSIEGNDSLQWFNAEGWIVLGDLDQVLEFNGRC